ncbi:MAG: hypothetical protein KDN20_14130 [Verrucomicrobiae bacterium]|nr:hypothetical protein [Verrucomicrobiae bacterium]
MPAVSLPKRSLKAKPEFKELEARVCERSTFQAKKSVVNRLTTLEKAMLVWGGFLVLSALAQALTWGGVSMLDILQNWIATIGKS